LVAAAESLPEGFEEPHPAISTVAIASTGIRYVRRSMRE
jgi:hypothetical protein